MKPFPNWPGRRVLPKSSCSKNQRSNVVMANYLINTVNKTKNLFTRLPTAPVESSEPTNRPFPSCCEPHYESKAKCKIFHMKMSFVCIWMKTNFHNKSFALSLAFIMRFKATRKWSIQLDELNQLNELSHPHE